MRQERTKVQRRLLLDVVVRQRAAVLELLAGKDETLLVRWDALLVLNLGLDCEGEGAQCQSMQSQRRHCR